MGAERIVITRPLPGDPVGRLRTAGFENVREHPHVRPMSRAELLETVRGARAVIVTPADVNVNAELFDAAGEQLAVVSNYAVGVDNVDLVEAQRRGIRIGHTPGVVTEPTADVAWLLLLGAARRAFEGERLVRSGRWAGIEPRQLLGQRVVGKTLLVVGAGRIGTAMARRSTGWRMRVLYHARSDHPDLEDEPLRAARIDLDAGLAEADFVSIHLPLTPETRHLFGAERLARMKPTAVLVNTARGAIVDEAALVDALRLGRLGAAGLDVFEHEPVLHPGLADLENVFLLPHLGSATVDDRAAMAHVAVDNVIAVLRGAEPPHTVV